MAALLQWLPPRTVHGAQTREPFLQVAIEGVVGGGHPRPMGRPAVGGATTICKIAPIGGCGAHVTSLCHHSAVCALLAVSNTTTSGAAASESSATWHCNGPNARPNLTCSR